MNKEAQALWQLSEHNGHSNVHECRNEAHLTEAQQVAAEGQLEAPPKVLQALLVANLLPRCPG